MKKVGILTYHRAMNFGAKLQAYALQSFLKDKFDTYIIDYRCEKLESFYYRKESFPLRLRSIARMLLQSEYYRALKERRKGFLDFDSRFRLTECYTKDNIEQVRDQFDIFIAGSDQIWNLDISGNDLNYFLPFAYDKQKFSYAASFGSDIKEGNFLWFHPELFSGFQSLIIREQSGVDFLNSILPQKQCVSAMDPVFLLDKETWISSFDLHSMSDTKNYILVYFVSKIHQTHALEYAKKVAKDKHLKVIYVNGGKPMDSEIVYQNDVNPVSFLNLIYNAYAVVTTSFHAEAFSILLNVPFMYELNKATDNTNTRLKSLAQLFDLEKQEIGCLETNEHFEIDWESVNKRLENLKNRSRTLLLDSLTQI